MRRQRLDARAPRERLLDVVSELCGLHAQVMSCAELTLWARVERLERDAVSRALWEERTLVKTWAMRGTLHLLPAAETGLWISALGTRMERHFLNRARQKAFGFSREDVARWWGVSPAEGGRMLRAIEDELAEVLVEGAPMWMLAADVEDARDGEPASGVRLLPGFDQCVIAATLHAEALMPGPFKARVHRPQGWISPVLLVDGQLAGVWRHERKGKRLLVGVEPSARVAAAARRAAEEEAERLAAFLGGSLELSWSS